jgi:signal transduction histidine kinase
VSGLPQDGLIARARSQAGSLSRQFAVVVGLAIAPVLIALVVFGWLMVISGDAVVEIAAIVVAAGAVAIAGARRFARQITADVSAIGRGLDEVGRGERQITIETAARDELRGLAESANTMMAQLAAEERARAQSEDARRNLVAAVSHDLRTPITSLQLLTEAIGDDIVDGEHRRAYVDRMRTHIGALSALIDDLFELSRLEAGDITWSLHQVELHELVRETVEAMRAQADAKGVSVSAALPRDLTPARANPEKLQRVLFNLIQNAIRHTPADGSVVIRAEPSAAGVEIEVSDTGSGIAPGDRPRVFTAFYRGGSDAARGGEGAGLGLAVSRAIVEAHGGRIWLADAAEGTRVRFSLPATAP